MAARSPPRSRIELDRGALDRRPDHEEEGRPVARAALLLFGEGRLAVHSARAAGAAGVAAAAHAAAGAASLLLLLAAADAARAAALAALAALLPVAVLVGAGLAA